MSNTIAAAALGGMIGLLAGVWFADLCWRWRIHEKARSGFRLPVDGRLYNVTEDT